MCTHRARSPTTIGVFGGAQSRSPRLALFIHLLQPATRDDKRSIGERSRALDRAKADLKRVAAEPPHGGSQGVLRGTTGASLGVLPLRTSALARSHSERRAWRGISNYCPSPADRRSGTSLGSNPQSVAIAQEVARMAKAMTKAKLAAYLAKKLGVSKATAARGLNELAQLAYREAKNTFTVPGIGKLVLRNRKARMGRNPQTGEAIQIPAKRVVRFRVAKAAKDAILGRR